MLNHAETELIEAAIARLDQADEALDRGDARRAQMDVLVVRNELRAMISETADLADIVSGRRRNAA